MRIIDEVNKRANEFKKKLESERQEKGAIKVETHKYGNED